MGRRIRPKTRPRPASKGETPGTRIKIRLRRESSDTLEQMISVAKKEAAKEANFKGFKSGKKSGMMQEKKKTDKVMRDLESTRERLRRHDVEATTLSARVRTIEKVLSEMAHTFTENNFNTRLLLKLNDSGVPMRSSDEHGLLATNKWKFAWGSATGVLRDEDGVDRTMSSMQRHRLHPGHRIPIRDMWPIWNAVSTSERPDIDPIQGMRGAWYYDTRRYSTHSSAMNAWRRHMHNKQTAQAEREARNALMPEPEFEEEQTEEAYMPAPEQLSDDVDEMNADNDARYTDEDAFGEVIADSDAAYVDEDTPEYREIVGADTERRTRNWRNRINAFLRSCELSSCRYWTTYYADSQEIIDNEAHNDLNAFNRVCSHFAVPLHDWDDDNWDRFRQDVNYYLEVIQNNGNIAAGDPSIRRRRRGRRSVTRDDSRTRPRGYQRSNY